MDHGVVAQQAHARAALDHAGSDVTARHLAHLGDIEHIADFGVSDDFFAQFRRQHAGQGRLDIVYHFVDDRIIAQIDIVALYDFPRLRVGANVESDHNRLGRGGKRDIRFGNAADAGMQHLDRDFAGRQFFQGIADRL